MKAQAGNETQSDIAQFDFSLKSPLQQRKILIAIPVEVQKKRKGYYQKEKKGENEQTYDRELPFHRQSIHNFPGRCLHHII